MTAQLAQVVCDVPMSVRKCSKHLHYMRFIDFAYYGQVIGAYVAGVRLVKS